jgi:glycosyltransferase involved in cell wall biosynthesis
MSSKVSYLGVDTDFYKPGKGKRDIDVLFLNKQKGKHLDSLFEKIKDHLSSKYRIIELQNDKKWMTDESIKNYYQRAKIVLCLSRNEPFGLIPLEAGATGCVVIALNEGGFRESVEDGKTGYLMNADASLISKKIDKLLHNPQQLNKLSKNAREVMISKWTWELAGERLQNHLEGIKKR